MPIKETQNVTEALSMRGHPHLGVCTCVHALPVDYMGWRVFSSVLYWSDWEKGECSTKVDEKGRERQETSKQSPSAKRRRKVFLRGRSPVG